MKPWRTVCDLGDLGCEIHEFDEYPHAMDFARECRTVAVAERSCSHCDVLDFAGRVVWSSLQLVEFEQLAGGLVDLGEGIYRYHPESGWYSRV